MADQAVYVLLPGEIKIRITPAKPCMANRTPGPVALNADAEIVDDIAFSDTDGLVMTRNRLRLPKPKPVGRFHEIFGCIRMAFQTGPGNSRSIFKQIGFEEMIVIHFGGFIRNTGPRIIQRSAFNPVKREHMDQDRNDSQNNEKRNNETKLQ